LACQNLLISQVFIELRETKSVRVHDSNSTRRGVQVTGIDLHVNGIVFRSSGIAFHIDGIVFLVNGIAFPVSGIAFHIYGIGCGAN